MQVSRQLSELTSILRELYDLSLSAHQRENFRRWGRPSEALPPPEWFHDQQDVAPVMSSDKPIDLVQDAAMDCSVVASLCTERARAERGHSSVSAISDIASPRISVTLTTQIFASVIYPFDHTKGCPAISESGIYIFKFTFNGTRRLVKIDDRLPISKSKRMLHIVDRNNPSLLWPALVEKAYLKVRGGYDFPGSNSNTDLWLMTGWIPEIAFLQRYVELCLRQIKRA